MREVLHRRPATGTGGNASFKRAAAVCHRVLQSVAGFLTGTSADVVTKPGCGRGEIRGSAQLVSESSWAATSDGWSWSVLLGQSASMANLLDKEGDYLDLAHPAPRGR